MGQPLHQSPGVDKHQSGAVCLYQAGDVVQGLAPHFVGGDWTQLLVWQLNGQVYGPGVAGVYNRFAYEPEKRAALEAWGRYIEDLCDG